MAEISLQESSPNRKEFDYLKKNKKTKAAGHQQLGIHLFIHIEKKSLNKKRHHQ